MEESEPRRSERVFEKRRLLSQSKRQRISSHAQGRMDVSGYREGCWRKSSVSSSVTARSMHVRACVYVRQHAALNK